MKTKEELNKFIIETEALRCRTAELTDDEMKDVTGGSDEGSKMFSVFRCKDCGRATIAPISAAYDGSIIQCDNCGSNNTYHCQNYQVPARDYDEFIEFILQSK